jgi:hypothetical protein
MARLFITGIYQIVDKTSRKLYVGSAVDLEHRKSQHFSALRKNYHTNPQLQAAFNKGHEFEFFVVERCAQSELLAIEQQYLDVLWDNGLRCFNVAKEANRYVTPPKTYNVTLISPEGVKYGPIVGLAQFAREHNLVKENLWGMLNGLLKTHKRWRIDDGLSKRPQSWSKSHTFISPTGVIFTGITNVTEFADRFGLKYGGFSRLVCGSRQTYKKWKLG